MEERGWAYQRRQPEGTVLYEAVRENLATLLAEPSSSWRERRSSSPMLGVYLAAAPSTAREGCSCPSSPRAKPLEPQVARFLPFASSAAGGPWLVHILIHSNDSQRWASRH